jgi:putative lipoprotein (rSAM/lipoprotein system)
MKRKILIKSNILISFFLTLLGFGGACMLGGCEYGTGWAEYGTPTATFIVKGNVSSEDNNKIPNIKVVMEYDTVYTNADGTYQVSTGNFPEDQNILVEFTDVDGSENGQFQSTDTVVSFIDPKFINGDGSWFAGEATKELNIKLKEDI